MLPLIICGVVPCEVSTAEVGRALLQRFTLAKLHGVEEFLGGQTEILFKTKAEVEEMLSDPGITVGEHNICFSYRGPREKVVRVSSQPMDASEVPKEMLRAVPGLATGVRYIRLDMAQPVAKFLGIRCYVVQCEYDGMLRVHHQCNGSGMQGRAVPTLRLV